jgi:hypothetical protein
LAGISPSSPPLLAAGPPWRMGACVIHVGCAGS